MLRPSCQTHSLKFLHSPAVTFLAPYPFVVQGQSDIIQRGLVVEQIERLKNEADEFVTKLGCLGFRLRLDKPTGKIVLALIIVVEYAQDIEQSTLAATGSTHDTYELTVTDCEVDALEYVQLVGFAQIVGLMDVMKINHLSNQFTVISNQLAVACEELFGILPHLLGQAERCQHAQFSAKGAELLYEIEGRRNEVLHDHIAGCSKIRRRLFG